MNIVDKTGRKLKVGQIVDMCCMGMFQGKLVAIKDTPIMLSPQQQINPHIVVQLILTPYITPEGFVPDTFIIRDADPNDPIVKDSERAGIRLVQ